MCVCSFVAFRATSSHRLVALNCGGKRANTRQKMLKNDWFTSFSERQRRCWIQIYHEFFFVFFFPLHSYEWVSDALSVQTARRTNYLTTQQQAAAAATETVELSIGNELVCTIVYAVRVTTFIFRANDKTVWRCGGKSRHQINERSNERRRSRWKEMAVFNGLSGDFGSA